MANVGEMVRFEYTNHKGDTAVRSVLPRHIWFGRSDYHPGEQWFLNAFDIDRKNTRDFSLADVRYWDLRNVPDDLLPPEVRDAFMAAVPRHKDWPDFRRAFLKLHPLCDACGSDVGPEIHHITPFHIDHALELVPENCMTLCRRQGRCDHYVVGHAGVSWSDFNPHPRETAAMLLGVRNAVLAGRAA